MQNKCFYQNTMNTYFVHAERAVLHYTVFINDLKKKIYVHIDTGSLVLFIQTGSRQTVYLILHLLMGKRM